MDTDLRTRFQGLWERFFPGAPLPICFYYTSDEAVGAQVTPVEPHVCLLAQLAAVRKGETFCADARGLGCFGAKRYLGFVTDVMPHFEHFLSCGIPGQLEGERYKKTPEIVKELVAKAPVFEAPGRYIVFKRWDKLEAPDEPEVVIFFATPDVLSGLFTLAGFDESDPHAVKAPFAAGCGTIVQYPYLEARSDRPQSIVGMFDVSARPFVPAGVLTFAAPMAKFARMVDNMEESFLITDSWAQVRRRIESSPQP